jgi:RimJ/RimL family protein N-acetyltransferase
MYADANVSPVDPSHANVVVELHAAHGRWLIAPSPERVVEALSDPNHFSFLVRRGDDVIGLIVLTRVTDWLFDLSRIIAAESRLGIGRFMIDWVLRYVFKHHGAHKIMAEVVVDNAVARRFFERTGFCHEGTWRDGFRSDTGAYADLAAYGMLESEHRPV